MLYSKMYGATRYFYALCDIDGFKAMKTNDKAGMLKAKYTEEQIPNPPFSNGGLGDAWGDAIVRAQAKRLQGVAGDAAVYRPGGDEFALVLIRDSPAEAEKELQKLVDKSKTKTIPIERWDEYGRTVKTQDQIIRMTMIWMEIPNVLDCLRDTLSMPCANIHSSTFDASEFSRNVDAKMGATLRECRLLCTREMKNQQEKKDKYGNNIGRGELHRIR